MRISSSSSCGRITQWSSPAPQASTCSPTTRGTLSNSVAWTCSPCRVHNSCTCKRWTIYRPKRASFYYARCIPYIPSKSISLRRFHYQSLEKNVISQTQQLVLHGNTKRLYVYPKYSVTHLIFTFLLGAQCAINALLVFDIYIFNSLLICVKTTLRQPAGVSRVGNKK